MALSAWGGEPGAGWEGRSAGEWGPGEGTPELAPHRLTCGSLSILSTLFLELHPWLQCLALPGDLLRGYPFRRPLSGPSSGWLAPSSHLALEPPAAA